MTPSQTRLVADRLKPFGATIFAKMTRLANERGAVNLSQGFPDFDGPEFLAEAVHRAIAEGKNQYARTQGVPALNEAIARYWSARTEMEIDSTSQVTVTSGCTEAIAASLLGLLNPGDEVILFEPFYDSYRACLSMAGAAPKVVPLRPPAVRPGEITHEPFGFEPDALRGVISKRTRAVLLNTPHNPTGKVFSREELGAIAALCVEHDLIAITDEVYEELTFEPARPHLRLATFPGMRDRTVTLSSFGKTFSMTGWKIGWAIAPERLTEGVRAAHQFLTFATATPLQHAAAEALGRVEETVAPLVERLRTRRDELARALAALGYGVTLPHGSYFILADHSAFGDADDVAHCERMIDEAGVAAIPPSFFYAEPERGRSFVRFAYCKRAETVAEAIGRLAALRPRS